MIFAIRNLRASRVNLLMNDFTAGLPSPLSFLGLADTLVREMKLEPWSAKVLPILHKVQASQGRTKPEMELKSGAFAPVEIVEDMPGIVDVSLLLNIPGCDDEIEIRSRLGGKRIAGGPIWNKHFDVTAVTADGAAFHDLRRGYAVIPPSEPSRRIISSGDVESLERIARLLFPVEKPPGSGWIVPVAVGHRLLENPETVPQRSRTRSREVPHVFAEPVTGIAELVSVRNRTLTDLDEAELAQLFWCWDARGDLVLGHPAYHPDPDIPPAEKEQAHA